MDILKILMKLGLIRIVRRYPFISAVDPKNPLEKAPPDGWENLEVVCVLWFIFPVSDKSTFNKCRIWEQEELLRRPTESQVRDMSHIVIVPRPQRYW
jgi:hypothetical protein